jgi:FAD:protein FMN transferase
MYTRILLLLTVLLSACSDNTPVHHEPSIFSGNSMTMGYRILIGHSLIDNDVEKIESIISKTFEEVHSVYNIWNPDSELTSLNKHNGKEWIPLSPELEALLIYTGQMVDLTNGFFDPTISSAYQLWIDRLESQTLPTNEELLLLRKKVGWDKVKIQNGHFWKDDSGVQIDLGGIAKGYCVDLLTERLNEKGYVNCYVEWGGEIRGSGKHPQKRPWNVYISHLADTDPEKALDIVSLKEESLATSGDYLQQWKYTSDTGEECIYTHVINPMTLTPIEVTQHNICSATVKAKNCTEADALATAAMIFNTKEDLKMWTRRLQKSMPHTQFWFVTREELTP